MKKKLFIIIFMGLLLVPFVGMRFYKADLSIEKKHDEALPQPVTDGKVKSAVFSGADRLYGGSFCIPAGTYHWQMPG